jgi:hypothetical protein
MGLKITVPEVTGGTPLGKAFITPRFPSFISVRQNHYRFRNSDQFRESQCHNGLAAFTLLLFVRLATLMEHLIEHASLRRNGKER